MLDSSVASGFAMLILNILIILILLWILALVHRQAKRIHDLDTQLKTRETAQEKKEKK